MFAPSLLLIIVAAAGVESWLLFEIFLRPIGSWERDSLQDLIAIGLFEAAPIILVAICILRGSYRHRRQVAAIGSSLTVAIAGPLFLLIALINYGHTAGSWVLLGMVIQYISAIRCWWVQRRAI